MSPLPLSVQRKELRDAEALYQQVRRAMENGQSRLLELIAKQERGRATDVDVVKEILVGWKGIVDDQENEIPFSIKARDQLLDVVGVASVLGEIFFESRARAKRKN